MVIAGVVWNHVFALVELLNFHFLNKFHLCTNCVFALLEFLYNCNFSINYIFAHLVSLYKLNYCTIFIFWHKFSLCTTCSVFALLKTIVLILSLYNWLFICTIFDWFSTVSFFAKLLSLQKCCIFTIARKV